MRLFEILEDKDPHLPVAARRHRLARARQILHPPGAPGGAAARPQRLPAPQPARAKPISSPAFESRPSRRHARKSGYRGLPAPGFELPGSPFPRGRRKRRPGLRLAARSDIGELRRAGEIGPGHKGRRSGCSGRRARSPGRRRSACSRRCRRRGPGRAAAPPSRRGAGRGRRSSGPAPSGAASCGPAARRHAARRHAPCRHAPCRTAR